MEPEEPEQHSEETGQPLWAAGYREYHLSYRLMLLDLQQHLAPIPDALQWLQLVLQGYTATEAARALQKSQHWLQQVREVCSNVLREG